MAAAAILDNFEMAISPQRLTIYLYSTHRAVIFAIAQLSCSCRLTPFSTRQQIATGRRQVLGVDWTQFVRGQRCSQPSQGGYHYQSCDNVITAGRWRRRSFRRWIRCRSDARRICRWRTLQTRQQRSRRQDRTWLITAEQATPGWTLSVAVSSDTDPSATDTDRPHQPRATVNNILFYECFFLSLLLP